MFVFWVLFVSEIDFFLLVKVFLVLFLSQLTGALLMNQILIKGSSAQTDQVDILHSDIFLVSQKLFYLLFLFLKFRNRLGFVVLTVWLHQVVKHLCHLFSNEWNRPFEKVHEVRQQIRMLGL